jgi:hypothetical protein
MRVLIDECVDPRIKLLLRDHRVATVHEQGWDTWEDGALLAVAQKEFDVLVTIDGNLEFQQKPFQIRDRCHRRHVPKNQLAHYRIMQKDLLAAIERVRPGQAIHVRE